MDHLSTLPKRDVSQSLGQAEEEVMATLFPEDAPQPPKNKTTAPQSSTTQKVAQKAETVDEEQPQTTSGVSCSWKVIGYTTLLFLIIAAPLLDMLLCRLPYCGNNTIALMAFKTLLFAIGFFFITRYL